MNRYTKVISGIRRWSPLLDAYAKGIEPEELKEACTQTLLSVLEDPAAIDGLRSDHVIAEAVNLWRIFSDSWAASKFYHCLELHRQAYYADPSACIEECARWEVPIARGLGHYWSAFQLEQPKGDMPIDDFAAEAFRNIGGLLEATMQPFLRELLGQVRIIRGVETANLDQVDFGVVVNELANTSGDKELFAPDPWGVTLSQWRNVAQHHNFVVEAERVRVKYGKGDRVRELDLSREDLWSILRLTFRIHSLIKTARTIFVFDHRVRLSDLMPSVPKRSDALAFHFATAMASEGFEVTFLDVRTERARAVLRDATEMHPYIRQFHASQLVQNLWAATGSVECELEYQQRDGTPTLVTIATANDCEAVGNEKIDIAEFGRRVTFRRLIDCNPPSDLEERLRQMKK